jgi:YegS/Rv2252/BmrU family lipid kinase
MPTGYLVYNPFAGRGTNEMITETAANVLIEAGWKLHIIEAQDGAHITHLARQAAERGLDAFFIAGGDGSMNLAIAGLVNSDTALGVLPAGTANVWAQEIGVYTLNILGTMSLSASAHKLASAHIYTVDVGLCNSRPFLLWAGVGLDAYLVHRIEPRASWEKYFGVLQYSISALWNAGYWRGMNLRTTVNGEQINGHYLLAVVSNVHLYAGGTVEIAPSAQLDDGLMDLWLFKGENLGDTVHMAWDLWIGNHSNSEQAECIPCTSLVLESDTPLFVQVDGEPAEEANRVDIQIRSGSLKVLIPDEAPYPIDQIFTDFT